MAVLVTVKGPNPGRQFPLDKPATEIGRHTTADICLESQAVSRRHARVVEEQGKYLVEDLQSSNGTFVNGRRVGRPQVLTERDSLQIGPYVFALRHSPVPAATEEDLVIRLSVNAKVSDTNLIGEDPAHKLQVILEIAQQLGRTLDVEELLLKLLDSLLRLFPQADRGMVLLQEGERFVVRAQRSRLETTEETYPYSRTVVKRVLDEGIGILSEDARADERFNASSTISSLDLRSFLCVPLIGHNGRRLGVVQLDRLRAGRGFQLSDLQLLTTVALQVTVVLENAALHAELLREERLRQELALARDIQQGFLPSEFPSPADAGYELFARVVPAREVSGDLYDFLVLPDGRLAFFIGDVSGKGLPAALFMVAARILGRHLASSGSDPAQTLNALNAALAADNPSGMFVTLAHGMYQPATGELVFASAGHPPPLLRRAEGTVESLPVRPGRLLGYGDSDLILADQRLALAPQETLIFYTDGLTEAHAAESTDMFGVERCETELAGLGTDLSLEACADHIRAAVEHFTGTAELQDDLTLFLLRRTR
jgi:serine phosphatase RsbU (regulator of sigma subunit)